MRTAVENGPQRGIYGPAAVMRMRYMDLGMNFSTDDLHPFFEGATQFHMSLLPDDADAEYYIGDPNTIALINTRLQSIRHPSILSRYARGIDLRTRWRAHEWRNWILYYCIPCLKDILEARRLGRHLTLLSNLSRALFLLSQQVILEQDLVEADQCIQNYVTGFEEVYGVHCMRFNIHVITHAVEMVRQWGNIFVHSTFGFESWNMKLRKNIKSPKEPIKQIINRYLIHQFIEGVPEDDDIFERVKLAMFSILEGDERKQVLWIGRVCLLGKGNLRRPTPQEQEVLNAGRIVCGVVTDFTRAIYGRLQIRSIKYTAPAKCDNTKIVTWDGRFCCVQSIMKATVNNEETTFMIVKVIHANNPLPIVLNSEFIEEWTGRLLHSANS